MLEEVHYASSGGTHIAYRVADERAGPDLVMVSGQFFAVEQLLEDRIARRFVLGLADIGRLVVFDRRGIGLSDPFEEWSRPPREQWADDLVAVIETAGLERPIVVAWDVYGVARVAASRRPDLVGGLVLINPVSSTRSLARRMGALEQSGGDSIGAIVREVFPSRIDEPGFMDWLDRAGRAGASPAVSTRVWSEILSDGVDLTPSGIDCPTLVLHRTDSLTQPAHVAPVVEAIEGARLVEVDGVDVLPIAGDPDPLLAEISHFATGTTIAPAPERVVAAVLFTDLVASTDRAAAVGDEMWRSTLDGHDADVAACVSHAGGEVVKFTGDGALAVLPSTRAAVSAAHSLQRRLASRGLDVRAGIHVGDIERRGSDVSGLAVNVAARIMDRAAASEILVSESVRVALLGSSATFEPADTVQLKGVPGTWSLFRSLAAARW